jgi:hypothetical protein
MDVLPGLMETREGLNPDLSVETEENSIGKESRRSWPDDPAVRAHVLQAIEELTRTSRTSTELRDECEVLPAETQ